MYSTIYYIVGGIVALLAVIGSIGSIVSMLTRKMDKVKHLSDEVPILTKVLSNTETKIESLENRTQMLENKLETAFSKIDTKGDEIKLVQQQMQEGFENMQYSNSLILEGLTALIESSSAYENNQTLLRFKEKLLANTIVAVKHRKETK
ncbi:MAG: hypothetical protein FWG65_13210 [Turicibacter sp.]|nr:hypothetical protein [Turicibacter sp.]